MSSAAVIATRFYPPQLQRLARVLTDDGVQPIILPDCFQHGDDWSLYRIWNEGLRIARDLLRVDVIVVMNDDAEIWPGTVPRMEGVLAASNIGVVSPDGFAEWDKGIQRGHLTPVKGTWGAGGMTGFCFAFRADLPISFDESYRWWYGDDDFEERVRGLGLVSARYVGIPIRHRANGSAERDWTAISALIEQDRALWERRHAIEPRGPAVAPTEAVAP